MWARYGFGMNRWKIIAVFAALYAISLFSALSKAS